MWAVGVGAPIPSLSSPNPMVALYLFGSCFGDWVGLDCGPKDVCRASPYPLYTPPLTPQSALCPTAWGQNSLLLQDRSPSGCLPTTLYTLTETAIPHPPY
ncbi:Hypothetical predicted protein [Marmota monax]|uniref:Uncharacterized protein n=1 Tax=Marmota monax TaxID=9995 RepID=A0A5E4CI27_MARMO|nr:hypothetical protein GHT09_007488 [Marmota monax]VTJ80980.1 Hypothetical predicted protein [Marmota monax]